MARKARYTGYCRHGVYVGGCGIDWMCGLCEDGSTYWAERIEEGRTLPEWYVRVGDYNMRVKSALQGMQLVRFFKETGAQSHVVKKVNGKVWSEYYGK